MFNLKVYAMKKQRFFEELRLKVCVTLAVCMALLLNAPFLGAQNSTIKVKGVVNDAMGPVIGASIVEKGNTGNGTITDIDGNFSLNVSSNGYDEHYAGNSESRVCCLLSWVRGCKRYFKKGSLPIR